MRLVRNLPHQLVIAHRPWGYALLTGGFAAIFAISSINLMLAGDIKGVVFIAPVLLSVFFFAFLVRPVRVIFDQPSNSVEIIKTRLTSRSRVRHNLDEIKKATLQSRLVGESGTQHQILLFIPKGQSAGHHALSEYTGGAGPAYIANQINAWLDSARRAP